MADAFPMVYASAFNQNARRLPLGERERIEQDVTSDLRRSAELYSILADPTDRRI